MLQNGVDSGGSFPLADLLGMCQNPVLFMQSKSLGILDCGACHVHSPGFKCVLSKGLENDN